jgi:hypothetical protein
MDVKMTASIGPEQVLFYNKVGVTSKPNGGGAETLLNGSASILFSETG